MGLEGGDHQALGIERPEDPADRAVLSRRIPSLQDHEDRVLRFRVQRALQLVHVVGELPESIVELRLGEILGQVGILVPQANLGPRGNGHEQHESSAFRR